VKIVAIYPAFAPGNNEMALAWQRLTDAGLVQCRVIAGGDDRLKAARSALGVERLPNLEICRVPGLLAPGRVDDDTIAWAAELEPDLVFSALYTNLRHARRVARLARAPILLHVETWLETAVLQRRLYLGIEPLRPLVATAIRAWARRQAAALAYSNPREMAALEGTPSCYYLPWPQPRWSSAPVMAREERALDTVAHVGFLTRWKGAARLGEYGARLLAGDPQSKLVVVGPAGDEAARRALATLAPWRAQGRFIHAERVPRNEAVALIGRSLAVISPHHAGGWGLIGDAWARGTPVIGVADHYDLEPGGNALVARSPTEFVAVVQRLRRDTSLWDKLSSAGARTAEEKHGLDLVSARLLEILRSTLSRNVPLPQGSKQSCAA
jgi:glycosyltransferase involved in cell wall biosynthesis